MSITSPTATQPDTDSLRLTDFMDAATLQEIQDSFAALAGVKATITDAAGTVLTQARPTPGFLRRQDAAEELAQPQRTGGEYVAPIIVNEQRLGTIRMSVTPSPAGIDDAKLAALANRFNLDLKQIKSLLSQLNRAKKARGAAVQFLHLLANAVARLCYQEFQLRQRIHELTAVYHMAMMLADARDLQKVLNRTVQLVCQLMGTKSASLRLLDLKREELVTKAVYNLSPEYLNKGPIRVSAAEIDRIALSEAGFEYVRDMAADPRVVYPQDSVREGIVSMLSAGLRYKGKAIGVLRVYTGQEQTFSPLKIDLLKAVAAQAATAIENSRLLAESLEAADLEKQVRMAADVQQRMIPPTPKDVPNLDLASVYVPCFTLGGDFYDFIPLPDGNLGLAIADVSGKGVPASLTMASVRAFLRAQVDNVYYLYEVMRRIDLMLCRDTRPGEFVTLFYGVIDTHSRRFTYCSAGHPPAMLLRDGKVIELAGENTVLGINPDEEFQQKLIDLLPDDVLLLYTDGLTDAMNFKKETFGRARLMTALLQGGSSAEVIAQNILWETRKFVGMAKPTDDMLDDHCALPPDDSVMRRSTIWASMKKRKARITLLAMVLLAAGAAGWGWYRVNRWCSPPFPLSGEPVIGRRVYSEMSGDTPPPANVPQLDGWPVIGNPVSVPPDLAKELREVLQSHSTYLFAAGDCFVPGMAVSFGDGPDRVDVVICLLCDRAVFYHGNSSQARRLTNVGKQRLKSIYDRLFKQPGDVAGQ